MWKKRLCLVIGIVLLLSGCGIFSKQNSPQQTLEIYYFNSQENSLVVEEIPFNLDDTVPREQQITAVMKALYELQGAGLSDNELEIKEVNLKDKIAYVTFNEGYKNWEPGKQILVRGSLVYSLTALDFIEGVNFFIEDNPLTTANGDVVETLSRTDFLVNALNPKPPTNTQVITLYFGKEGGTGLYAEKRAIQFNNNIPIERYILEELIKGPQTEGLINLVPSDTKINALQVQDTVCQIDISYDAKSKPGVSLVNDRLAVYAIVNSLTESSKVQKVSFLVDGKKPVDIIGNIDFNTLFEMDETLIEKNQTTTGS